MPFFRYSPQKYTDLLFSTGSIRVGTLHDFRRSEHAKGISDPQEGKKNVSHDINSTFITQKNQDSLDARALKSFGIINTDGMDESASVFFDNIKISRDFDCPDCFILCLSDMYSSETMNQFDRADSCYHIHDIQHFLRAITESINDTVPVKFIGLMKVTYTERSEPWNGVNWGLHPAVIKEPDFAPQSELRAIWIPKDPARSIFPLVIFNKLLTRYSKQIPVPT